jgi:hypothetical protein
MSVKRGIYRIAQLIKWTSRVLGGFWLLAIAYARIFEGKNEGDIGFILVMTVVSMAIAGGVAWVLEGFASD